jgi:type IV secretion system protein VirB1
LTAIIRVESGGNPHALHDNTSGRTYHPISAFRAAEVARALVAAGHSVDLGLGQINSMNLRGLGLSVDEMFDPCTNIRVGARILAQDYRRATWRFGPGQIALRHAIGAYNTGSIFAGRTYISLVLAAGHVRPAHEVALASSLASHAAHRRHRARRSNRRRSHFARCRRVT